MSQAWSPFEHPEQVSTLSESKTQEHGTSFFPAAHPSFQEEGATMPGLVGTQGSWIPGLLGRGVRRAQPTVLCCLANLLHLLAAGSGWKVFPSINCIGSPVSQSRHLNNV